MFPKNLLVSFTAIVVLLTSNIPCNYSKKLPKVSNTPGSSDLSGFSPDDTYVTAKFSRDPWNSGYMPFANPDFTQESASSKDQQSPLEFQESVQTPDGVGLNGWGRIPRVPKPKALGLNGWGRIPRVPKPDDIGLDGWGRIPRIPKPDALGLNGWGRIPRIPKPDGLGLDGWGRIPRVPKPKALGLNGWGRIPRVPKPDSIGLDGWGRIPRPPKLSDPGSLRVPPSMEALPRKSALGPTNPASPLLDLLDPRH
ncbi:hypothetical protein DCAR_0205900 [Daucus carota subsp. sativus]|uniref:Uncharacterized protein n=1 Tax=Daucus carota subsp. sativus TaxID=79200 RepID=A0AAF1AL42_DAUCS|nr:hypothetical protein DCAR_0205900 [Daucus carota subsp. sativus]